MSLDSQLFLFLLLNLLQGQVLCHHFWCIGGKRRHWNLSRGGRRDRKSTRLNSSHSQISYAVFCLKKNRTVLADVVGRSPRLRAECRLFPFASPRLCPTLHLCSASSGCHNALPITSLRRQFHNWST